MLWRERRRPLNVEAPNSKKTILRWLMPGNVVAVLALVCILYKAHSFYHNDAVSFYGTNEDAEIVLAFSFWAGLVGMIISFVDIIRVGTTRVKAKRHRSQIIVACTGFTINLIMWPLTIGMEHWVEPVNTAWLNCLNGGSCQGILPTIL